jgi:hypothetical protein
MAAIYNKSIILFEVLLELCEQHQIVYLVMRHRRIRTRGRSPAPRRSLDEETDNAEPPTRKRDAGRARDTARGARTGWPYRANVRNYVAVSPAYNGC